MVARVFRRFLGLAVVSVAVSACGSGSSECFMPPCAIPLAISVDVSASTGGALTDVTIQVSGAANGTSPCNTNGNATTCYVPGTSGTYEVAVLAPGFQAARRTVTVSGTTPACGCPTVVTQHLAIVLASSAGTRSPSDAPF